jgi:CheY-like chemotaxis protein
MTSSRRTGTVLGKNHGVGRSVLIIENDLHVREQVRWALGSLYAISETSDGQTGVDLFRRSPVDLVILGEGLPDCGVDEVVDRLRGIKEGVAIMALGTDRERERLFDIGGDGYAAMPPNRENGVDCYLWRGFTRDDLKVIELGICATLLTGGRMKQAQHDAKDRTPSR